MKLRRGCCLALRSLQRTLVELAAKKLLSLGCETVIITLGAQGSYVASSGMCEWIPAFKVKAVDTTGRRRRLLRMPGGRAV